MTRLDAKLQTIRQKLQQTDVPLQLRVVSYLRMSCRVVDERGGRYSKMLAALHRHKADWWKTCRITQEGTLESSDAIVNMLLSPIAALHADSQPSRTLQLSA
ncbi:hypothetical protein P7L53_01040 [Thermoleptolyngbya sichuanensis XZ-Cy5]|uniref:hypothetical protein n=1 Tax=Thermoleptolyngbya sichuanensis TaxID=2885951 RepID=UPI00240D3F46|nr:hypothetical protein [Thermoleptolyngbya sichuanensis]MDG2614818.1 hypothetical protein [Thermoleptolyngbya sichuanensis XZ-Cy5]